MHTAASQHSFDAGGTAALGSDPLFDTLISVTSLLIGSSGAGAAIGGTGGAGGEATSAGGIGAAGGIAWAASGTATNGTDGGNGTP